MDDLKTQDTSKLYVKSTWQPPLPPIEIDTRLLTFTKILKNIIHKRKGTPNLTPFQQELLQKLHADENIVYCHADKGLGPVDVLLKEYIEWALKHLLFMRIIESQAALCSV